MSISIVRPVLRVDRRMDLDNDDADSDDVVAPGEVIHTDVGFMRGHGTYTENDKLISAVAGVVEKVNKLVSVRPLNARYTGDIGDVVVGRITELSQKRWKVDINSKMDAVLLLSSINLPGGVQRRKQESDELQMRSFFAEGDLLSAEVQAHFADGAASIHTRSLKYGKLRNGTFVAVPAALVRRTKSQFLSLPCGVDVVLGLNGYAWVSKSKDPNLDESDPEKLYSNQNEEISPVTRDIIARVSNSILLLAKAFIAIYDTSIIYAYESSLSIKISEMLRPENVRSVAMNVTALLQGITK